MKKIALLTSLALLVAGLAVAGDMKAADKKMGKTHEVQSEIVSMDMAGKTMMIKGEKGDMKVPVMGKALDAMKTMKPGDKVTLTCQDDDKGAHMGVSDMKKAMAAKK